MIVSFDATEVSRTETLYPETVTENDGTIFAFPFGEVEVMEPVAGVVISDDGTRTTVDTEMHDWTVGFAASEFAFSHRRSVSVSGPPLA